MIEGKDVRRRRDRNPLENTISAERQTLQDLKPLLEDRGDGLYSIDPDIDWRNDNKCMKSNSKSIIKKISDMKRVENALEKEEEDAFENSRRDPGEMRLKGEVDGKTEDNCVNSGKNRENDIAVFWKVKCRSDRSVFSSKMLLFGFIMAAAMLDPMLYVDARSAEPRYETAYACEGKTLKISCPEGTVIHLIRANYGRFSITICNDHGNTDWSVNCMSTRSLRVLHTRCSNNQNCSILASTNQFGDPCPNTLKYLEAHYQCVTASTTSTTNRPSPPWLITSQPTVWRSTPPAPKGAPAQAGAAPAGERRKPTVITPPTFRPHITMPPELKPGDIGTKKTTTKSPESAAPEKEAPKTSQVDATVDTRVNQEDESKVKGLEGDRSRPRNDKPSRDREDEASATEESVQWPSVRAEDKDPTPANPGGKDGEDQPAVSPDIEIDGFGRRYEHTAGGLSTSPPNAVLGGVSGRSYCAPAYARGLHWNWTLAGSYAVQPCPGGATGLARWRCTLTPTSQPAEVRGRRAGAAGGGGGGGGLPSGENYLDLGLEAPSDRDQLVRRLAADDLLKSRDAEAPEHLTEYRGNVDLLPDAQASSVNSGNHMEYPLADAVPIWHGATPDLSECRSVWLNSLEARVREGESLLGISNDLAQVTSSKTLYGGDMMTTTSIMKKLAQRMAQTVHTFPERGQRVAFVTDMLLGVIKTGSNLLEEAQRASWADLSGEAQQRAATALLTQLEENAFLLADAVTTEKTILQIVKNICLSVRVLEVRSVEDETFPSPVAQEQWRASQDTITIPRAALLENRENELVRIVFVAFDRLEEILQPVYREGAGGTRAPHAAVHPAPSAPAQLPLNSERERRNVTRVLNSKVISASLGKGRHIQLSQSVRITLKHIRTENVSNPTCVFWDYTVNVWSSEGCQVDWSNGTHTGCSCSHLTNFAILMDLHGTQLSAGHELALRLVTLVGCAVSAVALLAAVIVFQCFRNMKSDRVTIHKNLCACLLIAEVIFMVGIDQTQNRVMCGVIAGLLHYFFLAAFAWMFLEGFHLYAMLVEVFEPEQPRARWYCAVAYAAPALIVLVSAAVFPEGYGTRRHCWLSSDHMFVMSFVGPVALVLAANWICLSMVIYMMCHHSNVSVKAKENSKLYKIRVWLNSSLVLAFLLGLTWTFGLLYLSEQTVGVAYAFSILNSLQGLFIFVFHCLQNEIFQKEMARVCRRHRWLSCCLSLTSPPPAPLPANNHAATASSSHHNTDTLRHGSVKSRRYQQSAPPESDDVLDPRDGLTSYKIQPEASRWSVRPTAPIYVPGDELGRYSPNLQPSHRTPTPQNLLPNSASHSHSIASMHSQFSYNRNNLDPTDYQNMNAGRSRSPSCFSNKMAAPGSANVDWGLVANPIVGGGSSINMWKNTSSKHHTSTLPHHDAVSRQMAQQSHLHSPYNDCDAPLAPPSPRHSNKDEESPLHQPQGFQTTRSYSHAPDFRAPHVYMSQHSPGSQEMIFRKHYKDEARRKHHHHHGQNVNHTYSEIAAQQGRMYRRGSEQEFRVIQDDPVYEEIERNETLMSDVSDDNSGPDCVRQGDQVGHHGSTGSKFYGDHRPLISYSPGERHHHEQHSPMDYGKYGGGKWDSLERSYEPRHYESGRLIHGYHQPQESNMRALAAVLNGENNVVCHLEPQATGYDVYQPQTGNSRTVSQPSF